MHAWMDGQRRVKIRMPFAKAYSVYLFQNSGCNSTNSKIAEYTIQYAYRDTKFAWCIIAKASNTQLVTQVCNKAVD